MCNHLQVSVTGEQANLVTCAVFNTSGSALAYGDMAGSVKMYGTAAKGGR